MVQETDKTQSSFRLVSHVSEDETACKMPIQKYISDRTGMRLYVCNVSGPIVEGYFSLATEAQDDDGLPHTLEHMIFLGSEDYPYAGVLDILANKIYAAGTNAWTDTDNTTYTISTVEKDGFLQLLPIYLDHIFYPILKESGYITEVYHVNGEGEDSGVVYSEMQSVENEDETIVERAVHQALYPNADCGYRYETGGILKNLRESCSHQKVIDFHKKMYRPDNMAIICAGQIQAAEVIQVLEKFEQKILDKNPENLKLNERTFTRPIEPLMGHVSQTVYFPSDSEETTNGIAALAWRGPHISDMKHLIALDVLFGYLTDSSISPLQSYFINKMSYCSKITYQVQEYRESHIMLSFINTQLEHLSTIKTDFMSILAKIVSKETPLDMNRMLNLIKMKITEINDKFEDEPHQTSSRVCIGDFLYGSLENQQEFKQRFSQAQIFEALKSETAEFWLDLADKYVCQAFHVSIQARPCEKLVKQLGDEDKQRVEERKKQLGKKGLKDLKRAVDNAIEENDGAEVPDAIYESLTVPSLKSVEMRKIKQFYTYKNSDNSESETTDERVETYVKGQLENVKHLQMQIDHLDGTNFAQITLMIDSSTLSPDQKTYLELFTNLLFESPIKDEAASLDLSHEDVVYQLNRDLLEFGASLGINGSQMDPGIYAEYFTIFAKVPVHDFELAVKWIKHVLFGSVFTKKQMLVTLSNLLKEITKRKTQPNDIIHSLSNDINFKEDCNICANNFLRQENFLRNLHEKLSASAEESTSFIHEMLESVRSGLLKEKQIRFYMCSDLNLLQSTLSTGLDSIWLKYFPANLCHGPSGIPLFKSNEEFCVAPVWTLKKSYEENVKLLSNSPDCKIFSQLPKKDFVVNLGTSDSAYLRLVSSLDINSYQHPNYAGLLVLIEYFCQTEGPLWEAVRGPGYCYHQSIHLSPELASLELQLDECSNLPKAYEATRKTFSDHLGRKNGFDPQLLETAKNSLIFLLIDDLKSVSSISAYSMSCLFKGVKLNAVAELFERIRKVEISELKKLLKAYIMPLFCDENANCLIVCHPAKSDAITNDFSQNFDRKLNKIGKLDECFCSLVSKMNL